MKFKIQPWKHQLEAIERASELDHFGLFFEMGCLAHDTKIKVNANGVSRMYTIEQLYRLFNKVELRDNERGVTNVRVRSWNGEYIGLNRVVAIVRSGVKAIYRLRWGRHKYLKLTLDHKVLTKRGFVRAGDLRAGDSIAIDTLVRHQKKKNSIRRPKKRYNTVQVGRYHPYGRPAMCHGKRVWRIEKHRVIFDAADNGLTLEEFQAATYLPNKLKYTNPKEYHIHHKDENHLNNHPSNLERLGRSEHLSHHTKGYVNFEHGRVTWRKIRTLEYLEDGMTYDISCEAPHHNFVANGAVVHNSGKTGTALNIWRQKCNEKKRLLRTLILCPPVVVENWRKEFGLHTFMDPSYIICLQGPRSKRVQTFRKEAFPNEYRDDLSPASKVFVTNYEALLMENLYELLVGWEPEFIICDESHKLKDPSTRRSKLLTALVDSEGKIRPKVKYRLLLSGTPVLNSPMDLFGQFRILDGGETFGKNIFIFRSKFFYDKNAGFKGKQNYFPDWQIKPNALDEINHLISKKSMSVKKAKCLDLPPLVKTRVDVEMSPEQAKHYTEMKRDLVTYLGGKACVATLALTKALRLLQITSGYVQFEDQTKKSLKTPKMEALHDLLEEITPDHKVLIWAVFRENYLQIKSVCESLGVKYVEVHGDVAGTEKMRNVDLFNTDPSVRVFIGHPGSGGIGINLVSASYAIFYSRNFSLEYDLQAEARNYRGGSEVHEKITRIDLVCKGTIDELVLDVLSNKQQIGDALLKEWRAKL